MAEPKFEKDLERLEQIVEALENGGLSLDDSLKRFEEGIKLARRCEKALSDAERRIEILTKNAEGEIIAEPFPETELETGEAPCEPAGGGPPVKKAEETAPANEESEEDKDLLF
jgi:exodeoxyribonuclease VII small subunit